MGDIHAVRDNIMRKYTNSKTKRSGWDPQNEALRGGLGVMILRAMSDEGLRGVQYPIILPKIMSPIKKGIRPDDANYEN